MTSRYTTGYRDILRELRKSLAPGRKVNPTIRSQFRSVVENIRKSDDTVVLGDLENAISLLRAQREYKRLLERYNPLIDLTGEERIEATARRVGLNMPIMHKAESG